jgi:hypothetical protein
VLLSRSAGDQRLLEGHGAAHAGPHAHACTRRSRCAHHCHAVFLTILLQFKLDDGAERCVGDREGTWRALEEAQEEVGCTCLHYLQHENAVAFDTLACTCRAYWEALGCPTLAWRTWRSS